MLHAVAHLGQHAFRHVKRVLGHEIDANALGTDELHGLLDLLQQSGRGIGKEQVRLIEKENELRLVRVAHFRQGLEQL